MAAIAFDTLKFARRLMEAGVPEEQAEVQAELMAEAFVFNMDTLVTRDYLDARFAEQDARIESRFAEQDARIESRFAEQDVRIESRFAEQDARFESRIAEQDARFDNLIADQGAKVESRFTELDARLNSGFSEYAALLGSIEERIDKQKTSLTGLIDERYNELKAIYLEKDAHNEVRFTEIDGQLKLHTWILGAIAASTVLPLLHSLFSL